MIKGYKVFNKDWTCKEKQYSCPGIFEENVKPRVGVRGMHFCECVSSCFDYYNFAPENHVAEVIAHGMVDKTEHWSGGYLYCTNKLEIVREIPWQEVLKIINTGKACTGLKNSGDWNSGFYNSGDNNTGDWNSGDRNSGHNNTGNWNSGGFNVGFFNTGDNNTGDWNSGCQNSGIWNVGHRNSGSYNTGSCNSGDWNSGNSNSGNYNSGDWNSCNFSNGCFNTIAPKIYLFNKPSDWTYQDWLDSEAKVLMDYLMDQIINQGAPKWVYAVEMTDEEKAMHPEYLITCGYLKEVDTSECAQDWWDDLSEEHRDTIKGIPNFDPEIFCETTGIKVEEHTED